MPVARFRLPSGQIARFKVPEGTTPAQGEAMAQALGKQFASGEQVTPEEIQAFTGPFVERTKQIVQEQELSAQQPEAVRKRLLAEQAHETGPLEAARIGLGRSITTIGRGLGIAEPEAPVVSQAIERLKEKPGSGLAASVGEVIGEALPFAAAAPLATAGVTAAGLGTAARVATTAALGGFEGAVITRGEGGDLGDILVSAGIGTTVAGALEAGLPVIGRIGGRLVRRVLGRTPESPLLDEAGNPSQEFIDALAQSGQSFDDILDQARRELADEAVDPDNIARAAFLQSQGLDPTQAQITRSAKDFMAQEEMAKTSNAVRDALERQEAVLTTRFDNEALNTGGRVITPTSTVTDAIVDKASVLDQQITDLYRVAEQRAPGDNDVILNRAAARLKRWASSNKLAKGVVNALEGEMRRILELGGEVSRTVTSGGIPMRQIRESATSVVDAERLRQFANKAHKSTNDFGRIIIRDFKNAIDEDVFDVAGQDIFNQARDAKRAFEQELDRVKISKFDSRKDNLVRDMLENKKSVDPDGFVNKVIFSKNWKAPDIQQLRDYLTTGSEKQIAQGTQAFNDLRAEVVDAIKNRSFIGPEDAARNRTISRTQLEKALEAIGRPKRNVLFTPAENRSLDNLLDVAKLREPVARTAKGEGPTAFAVNQLRQEIAGGGFITGFLRAVSINRQGRVVLEGSVLPSRQVTQPSIVRSAAIPVATAATIPEEQ